MLLALVGWFNGFDGSFLFEKIGDDYIKNHVPYIGMRLWPAFCGAAVVPVCFLILKELNVSLLGSIFGATLVLFDNALITQSRFIFLDSMLMIFTVLTTYSWIKFFKERHKYFFSYLSSYSYNWWFWLSMTGLGMGLATCVKLVGLFLVASVGIAVLIQLWSIKNLYKKGIITNVFHFDY